MAAALAFSLGIVSADAGTIFYQAIPASESDAGSGISTDNQYTSAVDGGNTRGPDRVINGITLYALAANGESATADNCTVNALSGNLSNASGGSPSIQADGTFKDALSDMTFNNGATDNSQQEIVLDPESLEPGTTYDLRVYICNSSGQNRQVNLSFVGDGQPAVETGVFNEDDARTSPGGFKDANQAYYINYRFVWDGDSTPGITITQTSASAPFILYALTNQVVPGANLATAPGEQQGGGFAQSGGGRRSGGGTGQGGGGQAGPGVDQGEGTGEGGEGEGGDEGLSSGWVDQGDDEVGVGDDSFYGSDSLNSNGQWVNVEKWGKAWQPTNVSSGWCPYTNGTFENCDDCGWTFVSEEPWAWACYHYGRWCKVGYGCGWAWIPGKVWAGSWVSWRRGQDDSCECIGWAPLPPEAGCRWGVGVSSWVDYSCGIGPGCYTFIHIRDFGRSSYAGCGCIYDQSRNSTFISTTINCTNISHSKWGTYCGGPDYKHCNEQIRKFGGKECGNVHVNRYDDPSKMGGKYAKHEGNQLGLVSPHVKGGKNLQHEPKTAANLKSNQVDHGWNNVKDPKARQNLKNTIAQQNQGKSFKNAKASLPSDVQTKMQNRNKSLAGAKTGGAGMGQHPGKGNKGIGAQAQTGGGQGFNQHPGKGKQFGQGQGGAATASAGGGQKFNQHPGRKMKGQGATGQTGAGQIAGAGGGTGKGMHPGQKKSLHGQAGMSQAGGGGAGTQAGAGGAGQHLGKHAGKGAQQFGQGQATTGGQAASGVGGGKGGKHKQQTQQFQQPSGQAGAFGGAGSGGQKHHKQLQGQQAQQSAGQQSGFGGAGGGGQKHRKQLQGQQQGAQAGSFGGAGGGGQKHKQQQFQQAGGQQAGFSGAGGGGQKRHKQQQTQFQQSGGQARGFGGAGGGQQHHKQTQQFQQQGGQSAGFGGARGGGQQHHMQQQQLGGGAQRGGQQPQRQGGKKGKKTPPPF